ncbi:corticotropin-releasing factor receptor 1-like isoform X1 [Lampetra fluviatilis]
MERGLSSPLGPLRRLLLLVLLTQLLWTSASSISSQVDEDCEFLSDGINITGPVCNSTLDEIETCWPSTPVGQVVSRPCPEFFNGVRYEIYRTVYRECLENGTWALISNYSECKPIVENKTESFHYEVALIINYLGHCISLAALVIAFLLFMGLRSIRCLRNIIHWNLISTFILRNSMFYTLQLIDFRTQEANEPWCRVVSTIYNYFHVTNFFWMFGEGCYLHTAIVMTYSTDKLRKWVFLCLGWGVPCPITVAWALGKLYYENEKCWLGKTAGKHIDYIYQGPVILVLLINFAFLFNIVRILMTKLRASTTSETIQYSRQGHPGAAPSARHHIHALLREPWRGRHLPDRLHLLQLHPAVSAGFLCFCLLLFSKRRGAISGAEKVAPLGGQAQPARTCHACDVHPHVAEPHKLSQCEANHGCLITSQPPACCCDSREEAPSSQCSLMTHR